MGAKSGDHYGLAEMRTQDANQNAKDISFQLYLIIFCPSVCSICLHIGDNGTYDKNQVESL